MELIIQAVELGAYAVVPVETKMCGEAGKKAQKKATRWQQISQSAAKQSAYANPGSEKCNELERKHLPLQKDWMWL